MAYLFIPKCLLNPKYYMKAKDYYWYKDGVDNENAWGDEESKEQPELKSGYQVLESEPKVLPEDWEFMAQSEEVLKHLPETWRQYPQSPAGIAAIIDMEYREMLGATEKEAKMHELVHLASACLYLWRELKFSK